MKVAFLFFNGYDGVGERVLAEEHRHWLISKGHKCDFFAFHLGRIRDLIDKSVIALNIDSLKETFKMMDSTYDVIMINSWPIKIEFWNPTRLFELYQAFCLFEKAITVSLLQDATSTAYLRRPLLPSFVSLTDVTLTFSKTGSFFTSLMQKIPSYEVFRMQELLLCINSNKLEAIRDRSQDVSFEKKQDALLVPGRMSSFKSPWRIFELQAELNRIDSNFITYVLGMDRSIGCVTKMLRDPLANNLVPANSMYSQMLPDKHLPAKTQIYGVYSFSQLIDFLSQVKFGGTFYHMKDGEESDYGDRMEYAMIEVAASTVPVFDKRWALHNRLRNDPSHSLYSNLDFGIWVDSDPSDAVAKILEVTNNKNQYQRMKDLSFNIVRSEFDPETNLTITYENIFKVKKRSYRIDLTKEQIRATMSDGVPVCSFKPHTAKNPIFSITYDKRGSIVTVDEKVKSKYLW